jgi:GntR family transcriptional regulator, carbon starvation induced regulator
MATLAQECYGIIEAKILNGDYGPGEKLGMHRLREDLGIGLSPIREALSKMVTSGLIVSDDNKGFSVVRITKRKSRDLSHTYANIESMALRLAIENGGNEWEANIAAAFHLLSKLERSTDAVTWAEWLPVNSAFHRALVVGCGSESLMELRDLLVNRMHMHFRMMYNQEGWGEINHKEHQELFDAAIARDADRAVAILNQHILGALDEQLDKLNLPED